ncbi:MAG: hypothetical protein ACYDA8_20840 [Deferrisomatales bacterium]
MTTRRIATLISVGLLTAALAAPAFAGQRRGGNGVGQQAQSQQTQTQSRQRLRDGSALQAGAAVRNQAGSPAQGVGAGGQRLRDGSCLTAPTPAE